MARSYSGPYYLKRDNFSRFYDKTRRDHVYRGYKSLAVSAKVDSREMSDSK